MRSKVHHSLHTRQITSHEEDKRRKRLHQFSVNMSARTAATMKTQESVTVTATAATSASTDRSTATPESIESPTTAATSDGDALVAACENGDLDAVASLLNAGVYPDASNADLMTPLCRATEGGHLPVVQLLLERGATVDLAKVAAFGKYSGEAQSMYDSKTVHWKSPEFFSAKAQRSNRIYYSVPN